MDKENMNKSGHIKVNYDKPFSTDSNLIMQNQDLEVREINFSGKSIS